MPDRKAAEDAADTVSEIYKLQKNLQNALSQKTD